MTALHPIIKISPPASVMTAPCIAAIDGGGTKTLLVVLGRDGTVGLVVRASGSNPFDQSDWQSVLQSLLTQIPATTAALSLGIAGYGETRVLSCKQEDVVRAAFERPFSFTSDVEMACTGAFGGHAGVLLLSGTGSVAWATDGRGGQIKVGGWGGLFGDEGSAFWIGRQALSLLTMLLDGRNQEDLAFLAPFANVMGLPSAPEACGAALLAWYGTLEHPRARVAALARHVSDLAEQGLEPARRLMREAANHLGSHIDAAKRRSSGTSLPWSYAGGTFQSSFLRGVITARHGSPVQPRLPPVGGGLLNAARLAGWNPDDAWIDRTSQALRDAGLTS
ncbi:N-acetylglucosamine kinase [Gluconobacter wancherniae]|uniref:N-acetylglucosamine kinase n=1 Tax=Gluconobacter wancherniae TaxID=1307955 RepID=UPI001B8B26D0|nr:BadF/BadG/BcrA/BcrD ATPase family protein [Gluconobacter wancherniae]MBS1064161.1 N-acetylglucosamine kinase [Gluconobacter wancherniae]